MRLHKIALASLTLIATLAAASASASTCSLLAPNQSCSFASDSSGGAAVYSNPTNFATVGSGVIMPFLGTQNNGVETGVNTDEASPNLLPLDDKRDNANTFTTTLQLNQLQINSFNNVSYYSFLLDANEPSNVPQNLLSIDRIAIFGQTGPNPGAPVDLTKNNITSLADVDAFPNLQSVYRLGTDNELVLDATLDPGSGRGYDMRLDVPVASFLGLSNNSRIVFAVQYGADDSVVAGTAAGDGFEEWAAVTSISAVPEPESYALMLAGFGALGFVARRRKQHA
jgi:hypothetical protein